MKTFPQDKKVISLINKLLNEIEGTHTALQSFSNDKISHKKENKTIVQKKNIAVPSFKIIEKNETGSNETNYSMHTLIFKEKLFPLDEPFMGLDDSNSTFSSSSEPSKDSKEEAKPEEKAKPSETTQNNKISNKIKDMIKKVKADKNNTKIQSISKNIKSIEKIIKKGEMLQKQSKNEILLLKDRVLRKKNCQTNKLEVGLEELLFSIKKMIESFTKNDLKTFMNDFNEFKKLIDLFKLKNQTCFDIVIEIDLDIKNRNFSKLKAKILDLYDLIEREIAINTNKKNIYNRFAENIDEAIVSIQNGHFNKAQVELSLVKYRLNEFKK